MVTVDGKEYINTGDIIKEGKLKFDTVREAYAHPDIKNATLFTFTEQVENFSKGKFFIGHQNASDDVPDAILNYPKVIYEPAFEVEKGLIAKTFAEVDEVRLPFPKITVLTCLSALATYTDVDVTKIDHVTPIYLVQQEKTVKAYFLTRKHGFPEALAFEFYMKPMGGTSKMLTSIIADEDQREVWGEKGLNFIAQTLVYLVARVVYMMTFTGGEFYIAKPTKDEIAVNAKRLRKGKKPLVEFRMIVIDGKKPALPTAPHGTHASPRQHWRRGHWRTMKKSGKKVWVDPMLVGDEENGKIIKDYAVGKYEERKH